MRSDDRRTARRRTRLATAALALTGAAGVVGTAGGLALQADAVSAERATAPVDHASVVPTPPVERPATTPPVDPPAAAPPVDPPTETPVVPPPSVDSSSDNAAALQAGSGAVHAQSSGS